jgi:TetR/AcrR family transcriptional regulator, regulator of mycofactocin system
MENEFERIALKLFAAHGFSKVSVEEIADKAGVTVRTFYRYFSSKEDVLTLFPRRLNRIVEDALEVQPKELGPFEALSSALLELAASIDLDQLRLWTAALSLEAAPISAVKQGIVDLERDFTQLLQHRLRGSDTGPMYMSLVMSAAEASMRVSAKNWYENGGDFVALVREALDTYSEGLT